MEKSLINGVASEYVSVYDRAIHYGDGVFETILCHGRQLYFWYEHFQRLLNSASQLKLHCPDEDVFLNDIRQLLDDSNFDNSDGYCSIKIILTRGEGERGYLFPKNMVNNRIVSISELDAGYSSVLSERLLEGNLFFCEQQVSINRQLAGLKHLNRLDNVMARNETQLTSKSDYIIDGLMVNEYQHVIEGSMSNLFAVRNNVLITPDLSLSGVNGIMRQVIIDIAVKLDIKLTISNLGKNEILAMDELFISNSLIGIKSVTGLESTNFTEQKVTKRLFEQLLKTMKQQVHIV